MKEGVWPVSWLHALSRKTEGGQKIQKMKVFLWTVVRRPGVN